MDAYDNETHGWDADARHHEGSPDKAVVLAIMVAIMIALANGII